MKKILIALVLGAILSAGWWIADRYFLTLTPAQAYTQMMNAARLGDEERFLAGFTEESAGLMRALLSLGRNYSFVREDPFQRLVLCEVIDEQIDGDAAIVLTQRRNRVEEVKMKFVDGEWKIDAFELEEHLSNRKR